jgi:excisionase family DNA binding protein
MEDEDDDLRLLTSEQVSELLQVNANTLVQWRYRGKGPSFVKVGRLVRYRNSEIMEWIRDHESTQP